MPATRDEDDGGRASRPAPVLGVLLRPDPDDPALLAEREALKLAVQWPQLTAQRFDALDPEVFTAAPYAAVHAAIIAAGGAGAAVGGGAATGADQAWVSTIRAAAEQGLQGLVAELAVEPVRSDGPPDERYADSLMARLDELALTRRVVEVKSRLQRLNPVERVEDYNRLFGRLVGLEQQRRSLRERVIGGL